jgi:hypothetical protein
MSNERLLSKQEIVKIIKHEFDRWLKSKDPAFSQYNQLHCVLSPRGFLSIVVVKSQGDVLIMTFDRDKSGDVMPLDRIQRAVDNNWWDLQRIVCTEYYQRLLDEKNGERKS